MKLMIVVPFFALSTSILTAWLRDHDWERDGMLGSYVYLPDVMGHGMSLLLIAAFLLIWYVVVSWNEETNKLIVPM